ncbi:MAG: Zn-ribbon domain-containing OB-fold protein [Dehalococcoidia bacterium]|nr:MAG: Zn-ribbon domain-containing OB-fold protein [Dehalococcoidia bacterium]
MSARPGFPIPVPSEDSAPFWEYLRQGELRLQRCLVCATFAHPPRLMCPECGSFDREWVAVSGRGTVYSYVVTRQAIHPSFEGHTPYATVVVELAEGPHLTSNLIDVAVDDIQIGLPVEAVFVAVSDEVTLPLFRRA